MITEELLRKCLNKDRHAWDKFVRRYTTLVIKGIKYKLKKLGLNLSKHEISDISQEVFLLIWEKDKLRNLKNINSIKAWLVIVAINVTFNYCKKNIFQYSKNTFSLDAALSSENPELTLESTLPSSNNSTANIFRKNKFKDIVDKHLSEFKPRQQLILRLNLYENRTQKDISRIMNLPEGTVAASIKRGKDQLKKLLKNC